MKHEAIKTYTGINIFHRELLTSTRDILNLQSHLLPGKKKAICALIWNGLCQYTGCSINSQGQSYEYSILQFVYQCDFVIYSL